MHLRDVILPHGTYRRKAISKIYYTLKRKDNLLKNDKKYDFTLDMESVNSLSMILKRIKKESLILEFGPANGRMTKYMKETLGCKIYAVELDEKSANDTRIYCEEILTGDIEQYKWLELYKDIKFDYIIFADVLEHLYWPEKVLNSSKKLLESDGSILISIPNISHNSILIELFNDRFTYHDTGLLDNTHIRFYTKKSFKNVLKKLNFTVLYEETVYCEPKKSEFMVDYNNIPNALATLLKQRPEGEAYQYIYELKY
jgi:2-polyprenyl-3-methyl-5-hydroxy-6-metoxy-1,4-benzoquinol methylase